MYWKSRPLSNNFSGFIFTSLVCMLACQLSEAQAKDSGRTENKIYGNATILTNYVDKGITQSDKNFALQAGFGYQMGPQARIGVWGSSVKLPSNSENVNLRLYFDVKIDVSQNSHLILRYDFNRYYASDAHNGNLLSVDFSSFSYHVMAETNSNWEGTGTSSTWFGFSKDFNFSNGLVFRPQLGYSQLSAEGYSNYFDLRAGVGMKFADVFYELASTYTTNSSQFGGRGDLAIIFGINASF